ncbi:MULTISPECIES: DUF4870 domain-containing protein [Solibacillus]|uniref:DUF4870 domain-containing protein n=1 Tax=Solibacillus faecavium TaxID=2762221 RepID=A0ABR8Y1G0_9BACL|nr:DUF4870 domain-containing protein [Solibacillus faecavium]MBD8038047.1 DUF4870 domain-containing protein [Solibacillus faecavium]
MESKWSKIIIHASAFFAPFLVPILFFLITTESEVKRTAMQALLFQVVFGILLTIAGIFTIVLIGLPFLLVFFIIFWGAPVIGIIKALSDQDWNYPIVGRWV